MFYSFSNFNDTEKTKNKKGYIKNVKQKSSFKNSTLVKKVVNYKQCDEHFSLPRQGKPNTVIKKNLKATSY